MLRATSEYRLITTTQYLRLFSNESRDGVYRRLQKLFHHGYLDRLGNHPNAPITYALSRKGAEALEVPARREVGERYVAHQLMIGNIRIALTLASRARGVVFRWQNLPPTKNLPIRPDGFFSLQFPWLPEGRNRAFFMLEADRSTMTRERFVEKLLRYEAWHASAAHTAGLGIRSFRVLTVTRSPERVASLLTAVAADGRIERRRGYWFACEANILGGAVDRVLEPVWQLPGISGPRESLLPECPG